MSASEEGIGLGTQETVNKQTQEGIWATEVEVLDLEASNAQLAHTFYSELAN